MATMAEWISIEERKPAPYESYLIVIKMKYDWEKDYESVVDMGFYVEDNGYIDGFDTVNDRNEGQQDIHVTHWMPLPEPPKED